MEKIILFGAGEIGKSFFALLKHRGECDVVECFCDNNSELCGKQIYGKDVYCYDECKNKNYKFVITTTKYADEIKQILDDDHKEYFKDIDEWVLSQKIDQVEWNRDYCAWYHNNRMDDYFAKAEAEAALATFWDDDSLIYGMFRKLDLDNVIELAVGRGRHVPMYEQKANHIVLVDILQSNIDFCKERFKSSKKIDYYCNNGYNLNRLNDNEYSALFTYDAMVHFEMLDIYEYLKDIYRVLRKGGMALFHHSNNTSDYKNAFSNAVGGRSYMSKDLFAYLAFRAGFEIIEQHVIDWGIKDLDCVSLIRKN